MTDEKYINYYIETLTATLNDCVIRNVSMQSNAKMTQDVVDEQAKKIEELQKALSSIQENSNEIGRAHV